MPLRTLWGLDPAASARDADPTRPEPTVATGRTAWIASMAAVIALGWGLRAFVAPAAPFHENLHGYNALALEPFSVPGEPLVRSSYLALMGALGLRGDGLIAANQVVSALVAAPVMVLARDLAGGTLPGLLAGLLVAAHPLLGRLGASEDPFAFYALTLLAAVVLARRAQVRGSLPWLVVAAALASVAVFARDTTVVGALVFAVLGLDRLPARRRALFVGLGLVPLAVAIARVATLRLGQMPGPDPSAPGLEPLRFVGWAALGGLRVLPTPAAFPWLAGAGLLLLACTRRATALRLVLALGLLQGPFALTLGGAASPLSPARHLSPAVVLWTLPAAYGLALLLRAVQQPLPAALQSGRAAWALAAVALALPDAVPALARPTVPDLEYPVMQRCLALLPDEARYLMPMDAPVNHVAREQTWLASERPAWAPLDEATAAYDARSGRRPPVVLLIDHACTAWLTMAEVPDLSRASAPSPWGPLVPSCAALFGGRTWQTVLRVDLPFDGPDGPRTVPVGCLQAMPDAR